jgi:hypothetical protein
MIDVKITRAEALLIMELIQKSAKELSESLLIAVEDENDKEQVAKAAKQNYVKNLEEENRRLEKDIAGLLTPVTIPAPHGYKKDGTPKAKPGRPAKRKTKGTK